MGVPESIRSVSRPKNTVVIDTGSKGIHRYVVRERNGTICKKGKNPMPRNGKTIGYIINYEYVPKRQDVEKLTLDKPEWLSYGASALIYSLGHDILKDLLEVYDEKTSYSIMAIAAIRIIYPHVRDSRLSTNYEKTFISIFYPGVPLSARTVHDLQTKLGQNFTKRTDFYKKRINAVCKEHHIAIDGMLKQDSSIVNDLSSISRKSCIKKYKEISIIYAYNIELMEPVCAQVFSGNIIDASAYETFLAQNDIKKGIIVADKGFPPNKISSILEKNEDLHFITPLKRNSKIIKTYNMTAFDNVVTGIEENLVCKKQSLPNGRFLYSFKDPLIAYKEDSNYIKNSKKKNTLDKDKYEKKSLTFGVVVFESDLDLLPYTVYKSYKDRWLIELVFKQYKNDLYFNTTRVQSDYTVLGAEFINFIANIITCRIINKSESMKILEKLTYGELIEDLSQSWRKRTTDSNNLPSIDDHLWMNTTQTTFELLAALGLVTTPPLPEPKKRGRPKKEKPAASEFVGPKRPRGRPRKHPKKTQ